MRVNRIREIAKEHAVIRETMTRIEAELDQLVDRPVGAGEPWALPALVRSFRDHLVKHFRLEELGGLLGSAVEYYDDDSKRIAGELVSEHRRFEQLVNRVVAELEGAIPPSQVPAAVVQRCYDRDLRKLLRDLALHEQAENDLLVRVIPELPSRRP